jgi:hypothetical protein
MAKRVLKKVIIPGLALTILFSILVAPVNPSICYANAAPLPSILIIVPNAPDDLEIRLEPENLEARRDDKGLESHFKIYSQLLRSTEHTVIITAGGTEFEILLDTPLDSYGNVYTLDLEKRTLTPGKSLSRSITNISLRVVLTLIIEGIIFFLFGYRRRWSWIVFLVTNIITQIGLNIWLDASIHPLQSYIIFSLIFGEILVFIFEMIVFLILVREFPRGRTAVYVIIANLISLIAGGFIITILPV